MAGCSAPGVRDRKNSRHLLGVLDASSTDDDSDEQRSALELEKEAKYRADFEESQQDEQDVLENPENTLYDRFQKLQMTADDDGVYTEAEHLAVCRWTNKQRRRKLVKLLATTVSSYMDFANDGLPVEQPHDMARGALPSSSGANAPLDIYAAIERVVEERHVTAYFGTFMLAYPPPNPFRVMVRAAARAARSQVNGNFTEVALIRLVTIKNSIPDMNRVRLCMRVARCLSTPAKNDWVQREFSKRLQAKQDGGILPTNRHRKQRRRDSVFAQTHGKKRRV